MKLCRDLIRCLGAKETKFNSSPAKLEGLVNNLGFLLRLPKGYTLGVRAKLKSIRSYKGLKTKKQKNTTVSNIKLICWYSICKKRKSKSSFRDSTNLHDSHPIKTSET